MAAIYGTPGVNTALGDRGLSTPVMSPGGGAVDLYTFSGELFGYAGSPVVDVQFALMRVQIVVSISAFSGGTLDLGCLARHYAPDGVTLLASPSLGTGNLVAAGVRLISFGQATGSVYGGSIGAQIVHMPAFTKLDLSVNTGTATSITGKIWIRAQ
jgi:hypothetical protein